MMRIKPVILSILAVTCALAFTAPAQAETTYKLKCKTMTDSGGVYSLITASGDNNLTDNVYGKDCISLGLDENKEMTVDKSVYDKYFSTSSSSTIAGTSHTGVPCSAGSGFLAFPNWYRGLKCENDGSKEGKMHVVVPQEQDGIASFVWTVVLNCLDILLQVAGILAVVFLLYNGFQYITSGGSADKISKAKTGMLQSIIGLFIAISAAAIIGFIVGRINP